MTDIKNSLKQYKRNNSYILKGIFSHDRKDVLKALYRRIKRMCGELEFLMTDFMGNLYKSRDLQLVKTGFKLFNKTDIIFTLSCHYFPCIKEYIRKDQKFKYVNDTLIRFNKYFNDYPEYDTCSFETQMRMIKSFVNDKDNFLFFIQEYNYLFNNVNRNVYVYFKKLYRILHKKI